MKYKKEDLRECKYDDFTCPYWDKETQKCTMYAEGDGEPEEECD